MTSPLARPSSKLFNVLVLGGIAMAVPACSSSDPATTNLDSGTHANDGSTGSDSSADTGTQGGPDTGTIPGNDSGVDAGEDAGPVDAAADACLNTPGDCTHGICSW